MSLLVWLPLKGDLDNYGLINPTFTNSGATVNNNGKIGKCYEFVDTSHTYIRFNTNETLLNTINNHSFSVCAWIKTTSNRCWLSMTYAYRFYATLAYIPSNNITGNNTPIDGKWHHVCVTHDHQTLKNNFYVDGVSVATTTGSAAASTQYTNASDVGHDVNSSATDSFYFNGLINDVRIYDHCLSPFEVSEISKALVLHYKLDDNIQALANCYASPTFETSAATGGWSHWAPSGSTGSYSQNTNKTYIYDKAKTYSHKVSCTEGSYYICYQSPAFDGGYRSVQFIIKLEDGSYPDSSKIGLGGNAITNYGKYEIIPLNDGFYLIKREGFIQDGSNDLVSISVKPGTTVYISEAWLENGKEQCSEILGINYGTKYDRNIYYEPDGSKWVKIFHHNNPAAGVFPSDSVWANSVYVNEDRWFDIYGHISKMQTYELMVKQKTTSSASEVKYRWIQTKSPLTATYNDVKPDAVTRITTSGYTDGTFGGLYILNSNTHMVIANATSSNWFGATGSWTPYQGGIPGYPNNIVTSGYMDIYARVDNVPPNVVYDSSGCGNNGTVVGTAMTMSSDSPRYSKSTFITDGVTNYIKSPQIRLSGDAMTISIWVKSTNTSPTGNYHMPFESATSGYVEMSIGTSGFLRGGLYVGGTRYVVNTSGVNILDGKWHMISLTYDGANIKRYIDGVLLSTSAATGTLNATAQEYYIGRYGTNSSYGCSDMSLSDARIYATALSESDMKELYDSAAWIDDNGNVECFECVETTEDVDTEIMKNGDAKSNDLLEVYDWLYLPAGTYVTTGVSVAVGDATKTEVEIRYATGGSGRDLMGWSTSAANYFGVTAAGAWEKFIGTSSDITVRNLATYNYTAENAGTLQVGALTNGYSTRNKYIYHFKFYKGTTLVADLWPAYSSGRCGLVNLVDNEFYQASSDNAQVGNDNTKEAKIYSRCIESNEFLEV